MGQYLYAFVVPKGDHEPVFITKTYRSHFVYAFVREEKIVAPDYAAPLCDSAYGYQMSPERYLALADAFRACMDAEYGDEPHAPIYVDACTSYLRNLGGFMYPKPSDIVIVVVPEN